MFHLRLLGPVEVTHDSEAVRGFESRKALGLLCYLAARGQPLSRSHIVDFFWGDKTEAQGRGNLSRVLHNLSDRVPGAIQADRANIQFLPQACWLDLTAFDEFAALGTVESLTSAVDLYRDEFMAGLYLDDCPDLEVWIVAERERWQQRVIILLDTLVNRYLARGQYEQGLRFAARQLALEPWREEAHRQMMRLLALSGQRSASLAQYETCRRVLAEELNAEPSADTTALYEQVRSGELSVPVQVAPIPVRAAAPPHNLPGQLTSFVGREEELAQIAARLKNPACRLLTCLGPGGIGKTRLALQAGTNALEAFAHGVWFVPLADVAAPDHILSAIADNVRLTLSTANPRAQLVDFLREKQMLLILDNLEHLLEGVDLIPALLEAAPGLKILVTSRERLNLQSEWVLHIQGLAYLASPAAPGPEQYPAEALLIERASSVDERFTPTPSRMAAIAKICRLVEGSPLAIELAAARVREMTCEQIAQEVESSMEVLATRMRDVPARHRSLRAVLDLSYDFLREPERALFRRLGVFAGEWTLDAAQSVCAGEPVGPRDVPELLNALIDKSLVLAEEWEGLVRYRLLETIRQYARGKLGAEEGTELRNRHLAWYVDLANQSKPELNGPQQRRRLEEIEREHDNFRAALRWAISNARTKALELAATLWWFWYVRGYLSEGRVWLAQVLALGGSKEDGLRAQVLYAAGSLAYYQGEHTAARAYYEAALQAAEAENDSGEIANARHGLGAIAQSQGDYAAAEAHYQSSLALNRAAHKETGTANSLLNLGFLAMSQAHYAPAKAYLEESLTLWRKLGDQRGVSLVLSNLGLVAFYQKRYSTARQLLDESLALRRELRDRLSVAVSLDNLGYVELQAKNYARARDLLGESLGIFRELGNRRFMADVLAGLAALAAEEGKASKPALRTAQFTRAARLFGAAQNLYAVIGAHVEPSNQAEYDQHIAVVRKGLDAVSFAAAWQAGSEMPADQAADEALGEPGAPVPVSEKN